jgi:hypothetical protein
MNHQAEGIEEEQEEDYEDQDDEGEDDEEEDDEEEDYGRYARSKLDVLISSTEKAV